MNNEKPNSQLIRSEIANLAAGACLIEDGGFSGANISIYEEESLRGGALDASGTPEERYVMRGERMFEASYVCPYNYVCTYNIDAPNSVGATADLKDLAVTRLAGVGCAWSKTVHVFEHVKALLRTSIRNLLLRIICTTALALMTVIASATSASAQAPSSELSANELAKEISNPVTSLWQLQFQFNNFELESGNSPPNPERGKWVNNLYFQPVMPVSLTKDFNLITRPVITVYQSVPHPAPTGGNERTTTFGDTVLAQVLSPAHTEPWIFAAGPTWIFPTAGSDFIGQGKWQVGPAIGGGYITNKFMIAAFAQQWWSFAGDAERKDTSQINILPLIYAFWGEGWSVGYSGNIVADWKARGRDVWTVPLGLSLAKVVKLGMLPVQFQIAGQYFVHRPEFGPEWNVQLQITPVIPRLINGTLFK